MKPECFLFDIGASHTRIGVSPDGANIINTEIYPTPQDFEEGVKVLSQKVASLASGVSTMIGGIAGPLNREHTMITAAPNLPNWNNKPLSQELTKASGAKVFLENDTALVGLGEAVKGAGKGFNIVAYMTVSTGVNGARIVGGKIDVNALGFEIGKQIVDFDNTYDKEARNHEDLVAGSQFVRRHGMEAHQAEDPAVWEEEARLVAYGIHNLILFWSPEVVVLGGAVTKKIPLQSVIVNLQKTLTIFHELPLLKVAEIADFGGLWGALHWAKSLS